MQTVNRIEICRMPTQEDWIKAKNIFSEKIASAEERNEFSQEIHFHYFILAVLFIMEKVGVKSIVNIDDLMNCLKETYEQNALFYPGRIFRKSWESSGSTIANGASLAELFCEYLREIEMVRPLFGMNDVLIFCSVNYASEKAKDNFYRDMQTAFGILKCKQNEKYISQIAWVAYDLIQAMAEKEQVNRD